jgi:hypothetical protein
MKAIKKACSGTSLYPKKSSVSSKLKAGGKIKKAPDGTKVVKGSRPGLGVFRTTKERTTSGGLFEPYKYKTESIDTTGFSKGKNNYEFKTVEGEGDKTKSKVTSTKSKTISKKEVPSILKSLNKAKDGKWIQKAINPAHKGYCTPMTKATCTPKRKALAKTLRKISKKK